MLSRAEFLSNFCDFLIGFPRFSSVKNLKKVLESGRRQSYKNIGDELSLKQIDF